MSVCAYCGTKVENDNVFMSICEVNGCADKIRLRWQSVIDRIGYGNYKFNTFKVSQNNIEAHTACVKFANVTEIIEDLPSAICLSSVNPGVGKTHLGVATVRQWLIVNKPPIKFPIDPFNVPWKITSDAKILQDVRKTYNDDAYESEDEVMARYGRYPILMVDDIGKYKPEKLNFAQRILFEVINIRYIQRRATIFTTNLIGEALQEYLGDSTYDRVLGMVRYTDKKGKYVHPIYEIKGESRR